MWSGYGNRSIPFLHGIIREWFVISHAGKVPILWNLFIDGVVIGQGMIILEVRGDKHFNGLNLAGQPHKYQGEQCLRNFWTWCCDIWGTKLLGVCPLVGNPSLILVVVDQVVQIERWQTIQKTQYLKSKRRSPIEWAIINPRMSGKIELTASAAKPGTPGILSGMKSWVDTSIRKLRALAGLITAHSINSSGNKAHFCLNASRNWILSGGHYWVFKHSADS